MIEFILDGVTVPIESLDGLTQGYSPNAKQFDHTMGDGGIYRQTLSGSEKKLRITLAGGGWAPIGLAELDYTDTMTLQCGLSRSVAGASNVITIPSARRSDTGYTPVGVAVVDGELVLSTISMSVDEATVGVVAGATGYQVQYWPELTVYAVLTAEGQSPSGYSWTLDCIEQ